MARQPLHDNPFRSAPVPRRDLLRLAAVAVALGMASPARALGSTLRFDAQDPHPVPGSTTTVITYPSGTMASTAYTETVPRGLGTAITLITYQVTLTAGGAGATTVWTCEATGVVTIINTGGTVQSVSDPSLSWPSGTATATVTRDPKPADREPLGAGGRRVVLPDLQAWSEQIRSKQSLA